MALTMDIGRWSDLRTAKTYGNIVLRSFAALRFLEPEVINAAADEFLSILECYAWIIAAVKLRSLRRK